MKPLASWAKAALKESDLNSVRKAVHAAESRTSGEFVVCVVRCSSGVGHTALLIALMIFAACIAANFSLMPLGDYGWHIKVWLLEALAAGLLGHFLGGIAAFQRWATPKHEREMMVHRRAELEFHRNKLEKTKAGTGILLFISLMERKAVVLADKSIAAKVPARAWNGVLEQILSGAKRGELGAGLVQALQHSADIVAPHFPRKRGKKNELSDRMIVKE